MRRLAAIGVVLVAAGCSGSSGLDTVDLLRPGPERIVGATVDAWAGNSVADAGDVNGDGRPDVLVGAPNTNSPTGREPGAAYVVFGAQRAGVLDLRRLLADGRGIALRGAAPLDHAGSAVAPAGDVNGDGLADVAVGAPDASPRGRAGAGAVYVVFGRRRPGAVELGSLGRAGYTIVGAAPGDRTGAAIAPAGDVNGDGRPDLIVGAPAASSRGRSSSGAAYVVFGRARPGTIDLAHLGVQGFRIDGAASGDAAGTAVSGSGDLNGDGRRDLVVGAPNANAGAGAAFVVFSPRAGGAVDLVRIGKAGDREGIRVDGASPGDVAGTAVAATMNSPAEVLVGAPYAAVNGLASGAAYLVRPIRCCTTISLADLSNDGYRIDGSAPLDRAGSAVAFAGDVNRDGCPDLLVGAPNYGFGDRGAAYVLLASGANDGESLAHFEGHGWRILGALSFDYAGYSVAGGGGVLVGARRAYYDNRPEAGAAYALRVPAALRAAAPRPGCS